MEKRLIASEIEYWTEDDHGRGYCSTESLVNAIAGHIHDMQVERNPLGPLVNVKVKKIKRYEEVIEIDFAELENNHAYYLNDFRRDLEGENGTV